MLDNYKDLNNINNMEELLEVLPIYGTYKSGERFINNPSWGNAGELAFNLGSDVLTFTGIGAVAKGLKAANVARKAYKTARATEKAYDAVRYGMNKLSPKIKHNNDVIHSLSLDNQRTGLKLLTDRVRSNNKLINEYKTKANNANKLYNKITEDYNIYSKASDVAKSNLKTGKEILPLIGLGKTAAFPAFRIINNNQYEDNK